MKRLLLHLALAAGAVFFVLPLVWMLSTALKPADQTMSVPPQWLPRQWEVQRDGAWTNSRQAEALAAQSQGATVRSHVAPRWGNFGEAVRAMRDFPRYLGNTVLLCILNAIGTTLSSAFAAYGFARLKWRGRDTLFGIALATMMIPFPVVMVPTYSLFRWMGLIGTLQPLWIGSFLAGAFNVFLLRQFFRTIPHDLTEAARIDGCGEFRIFWQIILPLCRPALVVVALFSFMGTWNDFLGPLIYLTEQQDFTLTLALQQFQSQSGGTEWHLLMAASTLVALPMILLFIVAQRQLIEGISMTGIKG